MKNNPQTMQLYKKMEKGIKIKKDFTEKFQYNELCDSIKTKINSEVDKLFFN